MTNPLHPTKKIRNAILLLGALSLGSSLQAAAEITKIYTAGPEANGASTSSFRDAWENDLFASPQPIITLYTTSTSYSLTGLGVNSPVSKTFTLALSKTGLVLL